MIHIIETVHPKLFAIPLLSIGPLQNPSWGSTFTPYIRLTQAYFNDNNYTFRLQVNDLKELPGARQLQMALFWSRACDLPDTITAHVSQIGQFAAHDITLMPSNFLATPADCCAVQGESNIPHYCQAVIKIDELDPSFSLIKKTCIPFRRAMTASFDFECEITPQIPVNQQSCFIDASQLYGPTERKAATLRSFELGRLKTKMIDGQEFGAQDVRNGSTFCGGRNNVKYCFDRGDPRKNQHFGLILYEEAFHRLHNIVADLLHIINTDWSDEILYQESRRIIIAINQIIVYRDYIPVLLGKDYCECNGLVLSKDKKTVYDSSVMPQLAVEFSGGGFRVTHNQIPSVFYFLDAQNKISEQFNLNEYMSFPDPMIGGEKFEEFLRGMSFMPGRCPISSYNLLISSRMFHNWISSISDQDLLSVDIQRGRDIGLPPYIKVRELCDFPIIESFDDLVGVLSDLDIALLKRHYDSVEDIDLIVGILCEPPADGAMVGETARCIIADGFHRLRVGDRFFCDVQCQPGSFTTEQFDVLWNFDLTKVFCAATKIDALPSDIFIPNGQSEEYNCALFNFDLGAWKVDTTNS